MTTAPLRYSIAAPDYDPALGNRLVITVDGDHFRDVAAYDVIAGWVDTAAHDDNGVIMEKDGQFCVRRYHGKVVAVLL